MATAATTTATLREREAQALAGGGAAFCLGSRRAVVVVVVVVVPFPPRRARGGATLGAVLAADVVVAPGDVRLRSRSHLRRFLSAVEMGRCRDENGGDGGAVYEAEGQCGSLVAAQGRHAWSVRLPCRGRAPPGSRRERGAPSRISHPQRWRQVGSSPPWRARGKAVRMSGLWPGSAQRVPGGVSGSRILGWAHIR